MAARLPRIVGFVAAALFLAEMMVTPVAFVPPITNRLALVKFVIERLGLIACPLLVAASLVRARGLRFILLAIPVLAQCGPVAVLYVWKLFTRQVWMNRATMLGICAALACAFGLLLASAGLWGRWAGHRARPWRLATGAGVFLVTGGGLAAAALAFVFSPTIAWPGLSLRAAATGLLDWVALVAFLELTAPTVDPRAAPAYHGGQ